MDYFDLGSSPTDEMCAQVGDENYRDLARVELREFKRMMREVHPEPDDANAHYAVKRFEHDFGSYFELCAVYDEDDESALNWACDAEEKVPAVWDAHARAEINKVRVSLGLAEVL